MKRLLLQFDTDPLPSSFDRVVAIDAGADEVFAYGGVTAGNATPLVHGAMFTRSPDQLQHTAIFIGGSDVAAGDELLKQVLRTFFGPLRVSVLMDSNGSNTTAAAAVRSAARHLSLPEATALVLGGTGPVGHRAAQLLAASGACVRVASRSVERAGLTCDLIRRAVTNARLQPFGSTGSDLLSALEGVDLLIAAGAAGVQFLNRAQWGQLASLKVAIDVNAVPPLGLEGIGVTDKAALHGSVFCYGALGVGGLKMKVHKAAVMRLFEASDLVLDTEAVYRIAESFP
jgi:hypothetical protein